MSLASLTTLEGTWSATYQLRGDPSFEHDSPSRATVIPMLGGRFVRIDYTWSDRSAPQAGSLLVGYEDANAEVTMVWIDSWHNGARMMVCTGQLTVEGGIDVRGTYPTGAGSPAWGWRTRITPADSSWTLRMDNVSPEGEEWLAVAADYRRA